MAELVEQREAAGIGGNAARIKGDGAGVGRPHEVAPRDEGLIREVL